MEGMISMLGNKQLEKIICVACTEPFGNHSKRDLIRCCFRLQGTLVSDGIENKPIPDLVPKSENLP